MTSPNLQLVSAIFSDNSSRIWELVEQEQVNVNDKGCFCYPPLLRAALYGKLEALKTLLEFGADKNIRDNQGRTALELARKYNHSKIVEILSKTDTVSIWDWSSPKTSPLELQKVVQEAENKKLWLSIQKIYFSRLRERRRFFRKMR